MFQTFGNSSEKQHVKQRITHLRILFSDYKIDGYFVPRVDEFGNEYLPECSER